MVYWSGDAVKKDYRRDYGVFLLFSFENDTETTHGLAPSGGTVQQKADNDDGVVVSPAFEKKNGGAQPCSGAGADALFKIGCGHYDGGVFLLVLERSNVIVYGQAPERTRCKRLSRFDRWRCLSPLFENRGRSIGGLAPERRPC